MFMVLGDMIIDVNELSGVQAINIDNPETFNVDGLADVDLWFKGCHEAKRFSVTKFQYERLLIELSYRYGLSRPPPIPDAFLQDLK